METVTRVQNSIDFIEEHLQEDISVRDISFVSCYSKYHFQRLFSFITGMPVMEYVRRRRLSAAAYEMCRSDKRIIDVAYDYRFGYEQTFIRAFSREFGMTPARFRRDKRNIRICMKLSLADRMSGNPLSGGLRLHHELALAGRQYSFDPEDNRTDSVCYRIKSGFLVKYLEQLRKYSVTERIPLYSFIIDYSDNGVNCGFILAVPVNILSKIPSDFRLYSVPLHLHYKSYGSCPVNIHDLVYTDLLHHIENTFYTVYSQSAYRHNNSHNSSYIITDLGLVTDCCTPYILNIPVSEK